ncbi:MAG TPA: hypothetical protein VLJ68_02370 [Chitinophagaceae bacterium]|nr:hypothetical protein [Chitinophagaceae bacterium]
MTLSLLVLIIGTLWWWNANKGRIIRNKIISTIYKKTNGLYRANIGKVKVSFLNGNISVRDIEILYDSVKYAELVKEHSAPPVLMNLRSSRVVLSGVRTKFFKLKDRLLAKKLQVLDPTVELLFTHEEKDSVNKKSVKALYRQLLGDMDYIRFDVALVSNANVVTKNFQDKKEDFIAKNMNLTLRDVQIDSIGSNDSTRILFSKRIAVFSDTVTWYSSARLYKYGFINFTYNTEESDLYLGQLRIEPQLSETAFASSFPYQTDRFDVDLKDIRIKDLDIPHVMKEEVWAQSLDISQIRLKLYRDLTMPRRPGIKPAENIGEQLMQIPVPLMFHSTNFPSLSFSYRQKGAKSGDIGDLRFDNSSLFIQNLTNMPEELAHNNICKIDARTRLLNMLPVSIGMVLTLGSKDGTFSMEGSTGSGLDLTRLNELTMPMGLNQIKSGQMHSLKFNFNGNNFGLKGSLTGLYDHLKIDFLEYGDDKKINKRHLGTLLRDLFIRDDNPHDEDGIRIAKVEPTRDMSRSFYNLLWQGILDGIMTTIVTNRGLPIKTKGFGAP